MRGLVLPLALCALVASAAPAMTWGNGTGSNPDFPHYGVHDAIAHLALEKLRAHEPSAAAWLGHWFLPNPGGYGASFDIMHLKPQGSDNLLGYTDDPDSVFQDWCNHLYMVHPRPGEDEQCAPDHVGRLVERARTNLTLSMLLANLPCNPLEHMAAYNAGLLAHYLGDLSQWGHTDGTRRDHSHPPQDPDDRTYHGYYESAVWGSQGLRALLADQRARAWAPDLVGDVPAAVRGLARHTNMPDGVTVNYVDLGGATVQVGSGYKAMIDGYVAAYDANQRHLGMRGYTPALFARTMDSIAADVDLLADLWYTVWAGARAAVPVQAPTPVGLPGCPAA